MGDKSVRGGYHYRAPMTPDASVWTGPLTGSPCGSTSGRYLSLSLYRPSSSLLVFPILASPHVSSSSLLSPSMSPLLSFHLPTSPPLITCPPLTFPLLFSPLHSLHSISPLLSSLPRRFLPPLPPLLYPCFPSFHRVKWTSSYPLLFSLHTHTHTHRHQSIHARERY